MERLITRRKLFRVTRDVAAGAVGLYIAKKLGLEALATEGTRPLPYEDIDQVAEIHGARGRWDFLEAEPKKAALLRERAEDTAVWTDRKTVAEGYQLLDEPDLPAGVRFQPFVLGPGLQLISDANKVEVKGILMRRFLNPEESYNLILSERTASNSSVIGSNGWGGKGDMRGPFRVIPYSGGLEEVAARYGGIASDYDWVDGRKNFVAKFKEDSRGHRFVSLNGFDTNTVLIGKQHLWNPREIRKQLVVVGPGQSGVYIINAFFSLHEGVDNYYKYAYALTLAENPNTPVLGVNGFRGGEK